MSRRLVNITLDNLEDLPSRCRRCVFWELDPVSKQRAEDCGDPELEKEAWISATLLEWGSCGKIVYVDGVPAGTSCSRRRSTSRAPWRSRRARRVPTPRS